MRGIAARVTQNRGQQTMAKKAVKRKAAGSSSKGSAKGRKKTPSSKRTGSGTRAAAQSGAGARRTSAARRNTGRKTAGAKTPQGKKRRAKTASSRTTPRRTQKKAAKSGRAPKRREGGSGLDRDLAQTPETGRSVKGRINPMATRRSTGTAAGAGNMRQAPGLERARRQLREVEETLPGPPSSLDLDRRPSAARSGRREMEEARRDHNEVSPELTAGDVDADWQDAYSVGDEAPGGDNMTPDQDRVDDIGKALGVQYEDNEELKASDKITERDKHRWELDPASSDDYRDRD
jgi:hypothetical protein